MSDYGIAEVGLDDFKAMLKDSAYMSPAEYNYWKARNNRTFYIDYEIDETYELMELCKTILQINADDASTPKEELKPIVIYVHSFGGDVYQKNALTDILCASRTPVITVGLGVIMSSGFDIFLAGHRRYAFEHSQFLCHAGYGAMQGSQSELAEANKNNKYRLEMDKQYILSRTAIPETVYKKMRDKDWYFTADEVRQYNIATIITSLDEIV